MLKLDMSSKWWTAPLALVMWIAMIFGGVKLKDAYVPTRASTAMVGTATAIMRIDQIRAGGTSTGTPGIARKDLWNGSIGAPFNRINLISTGTGIAPFMWTMLAQPYTSAASIINPTSSSAYLIPDKLGTYRIQLSVSGGAATQIRVARVTLDSLGLAPFAFEVWVPAPGELGPESNYSSNIRGWDERFVGMVGDDDKLMRTVTTITALINSYNEDGLVLTVYFSPPSGAVPPGTFRWNGASAATHDGYNIVQPGFGGAAPLATGRWIRQNAIASSSAACTPGNIVDLLAECPVTVASAKTGDFATGAFVITGTGLGLPSGVVLTADVPAANTCLLRFDNHTGAPITIGAGTAYCTVQER